MSEDLFPYAVASPVSLDEQIECVVREIQMRHLVYSRRVLARQMTQKTADKEIARMEAVRDTLTNLKAQGGR